MLSNTVTAYRHLSQKEKEKNKPLEKISGFDYVEFKSGFIIYLWQDFWEALIFQLWQANMGQEHVCDYLQNTCGYVTINTSDIVLLFHLCIYKDLRMWSSQLSDLWCNECSQ